MKKRIPPLHKTIIIVVATTIIYLVGFFNHDAHAISHDLKDQASCLSISGTWNTSTSTCTIYDFNLNSGDLLAVDNSVFPTISLAITDALDNNGGVISNTGVIIVSNSGVFTNEGSIINYCTSGCVGGTIQNDGTITNNNGGTITNNGTISNSGSINNSGTITINNGGTLDNLGKFTNNGGTINNSGTIHNNELSAIINGGIITNYYIIINDLKGTVTNSGTMKNMCGGTITSNGDLLGIPVNNTSCVTNQKSATVPEFPFTMPILAISFLSLIVFYKTKKQVLD